MSAENVFSTVIFPVLYLIGLVVIYCHQRFKIGALESTLRNTNNFMAIFDLEKVKQYSTMGEEKTRFEYDKKISKLEEIFEKERTEKPKDRERLILDFTKLSVALMRPMVDSWYLEFSLNDLPDGDVKDAMRWLREEIRKLNKEFGIKYSMFGTVNPQLTSEASTPSEEKK